MLCRSPAWPVGSIGLKNRTAGALGFHPAEAAAELLICHASWLHRLGFRDSYVHVGTSISDSPTTTAAIDWPAAIV
jgi:hypothetical protein